MYAEHTTIQIIGQVMIAILFLGTGVINSTTKVKQHLDRMLAMNIPYAATVLWIGFVWQHVGGLMVLFDYHSDIGAILLIVFTIIATALFHRFWHVEEPLRRHFHVSFIFGNTAVIGGLLLLI